MAKVKLPSLIGVMTSIACLLMLLPIPIGLCQLEQETSSELPFQLRDGLIEPQQRFWIPGNDGRPLMQITLEELRELERVYREATQLPAFLESAQLRVGVEKSFASLSASFTADIRGAATVQRFELGMKNSQLVEQPLFDQTGESSQPIQQRVIPSQDGYQWLILSPQPTRQQVSLKAKTVLEQTADRMNLSLDLPLVSTTVEILLPANATEERLRTEDILVERSEEASSVRLLVKTRGGAFSVSWRESRPTGPLGMVEAKSDTVYEPFDLLDSSQIWSATTTLNVRWFGGDGSNKVQVALPPGGQWSSLPYSEFDRFRLTTMVRQTERTDNQTNAQTDDSNEVLIIENLDPAEFPAVENLNLQWRWLPVDAVADRSMATFSIPSPEITGVDTHEGMISLIYPSIFNFSYQEGPGVRFIDQGRVADLGLGRHQAQFAFQQSSASVNVNFRHETQSPTVRTVYRVHVSEGRLNLTAWIRCWFEGGPMELGWIPGDWVTDEGSAVVLRDPTLPLTSPVEPLIVRPRGYGAITLGVRDFDSIGTKQTSEQTWRLSASRPWDSEDPSEIQFLLPALDKGSSREETAIGVGSGILLITSDKNLLVSHSGEAKSDAWVEFYSPEHQLYCPPGSRRPLAYRFHDQVEPTSWTGQVTLLPQQIVFNQNVEIAIGEKKFEIEQDFNFRVANRPLSRLRLLVHEDALPIEASIGDYLMPYEIVSSNNEVTSGPADSQWKQLELIGVPDLIGSARLTIRSAIDWQRSQANMAASSTEQSDERTASSDRETAVNIPLVQLLRMPAANPGRTLCRLRPNVNFDVRPSQDTVKGRSFTMSTASPFELRPDQRTVELTVRQRALIDQQSVVTNGMWLQTILSGNERRDRFVVRVRSSKNQIAIQLPEQSRVETVALDGLQLGNDAAPYDYNSNQLAVSLPNSNEHVVEVIYLLSEPLTWAHRFRMVPAKVLYASSQERFYWQLATPGINHLGWCPAPLTSEWQWQWDTIGLSRKSEHDQGTLEAWTGAATLTRIPISANSYVMSGLDEFPTIEVWIFSRFALWFPMGVIAILLAVGVLNVPKLRSPNCFILAAALTAAAAAVWPDMSMLIGQTALATLVLVALVFLTQAAVQSRVNRRSIFSARMQSRREPSDAFTGSRGRMGSLSSATAKVASLESTGAE